jgi:hydrogenase expression/formation protein HypC
MCLAVPMKIVEMILPEAVVELGGVRRRIHLALLATEDLRIGDYVIVHAGFAIQKMDKHEALETLKILEQLADIQE